ncbi:H(+)/Cl(-) exchange transporter 7-like isoform X1 [Metopolophium dirhodum]|uniref:H(+)/Cl(-) exchange transporter 7-like isoform X1 n=1 Tax=Metopolophium dirhodum TaxID=44670 RepID=UPI00299020A2|nr:H(+)/Cl(-) exchange transporter 7-like isoform X1 [Metopolophium dirhodum]
MYQSMDFKGYDLSKESEEIVPIGSLNHLSTKYESLDYEVIENELYREEEQKKGYRYVVQKDFSRWMTFFWIGVSISFIGIIIFISIEIGTTFKFNMIKKYFDGCTEADCMVKPYLVALLLNLIPSLVGSCLIVYVEPMAKGSGIPAVKCFLNGIKVPRLIRLKTLVVKVIGVTCVALGGMWGGKEGPMIHAGSIVAAGVSQGKSTTFNKDLGALNFFREDHEKRDFVSGGAAAGIAAAFGAPVGGLLFSLEEGASFWNQALTWRTFFGSMVSMFTLHSVLSAYHGHPGDLTYKGLLNFGKFDDLSYHILDIPVFVLMGIIGGLTGALFCHLNLKLVIFRKRYVNKDWKKVLEVLIVCATTVTISFLLILFTSDCKKLGLDPTDHPIQFGCNDGEFNAMAALWFQLLEGTVRSLFHDTPDVFNTTTVVYFCLCAYFITLWTYGVHFSGGVLIPGLCTGAAWGRLVGRAVFHFFPNTNIGIYSLIGAASQLGGITRMTISLTIILVEATGSITFGLPLMICLMTAKWVGDFFSESIYDTQIELSGMPLLAWDPPPLSSNIYANNLMTHPVITFKTKETVGNIVKILKTYSHNGFPVIEYVQNYELDEGKTKCYLRGLILRSQLIVLLENKVFHGPLTNYWDSVTMETFREDYPRYSSIEDIELLQNDLKLTIDLSRFMNPSPYIVQHTMSLPRIFKLFRAMGLRHIVVVNDSNEVAGIVTRKDLARYKVIRHMGKISVTELKFSSKMD